MGRFAWRRTVCAWLVTVPLLAFGAAAAAATVIERETFSGTDSFTEDGCGFPLAVEATFSGRAHIRVDRGGEAFLQQLNITFRDVWTNTETGRYFVLRGHSVFKELKATRVDGDVYEFTAIEAGQPFVLEDAAGNVVARDRGVIRGTFLFDTLGDGMPGGEFIADTSLSVHGPHPGFADDFPFCEIAEQLTTG